MASVSILYLDWNFLYFITKACLKFVLATRKLGRGGGGPGPQGPAAATTPTSSRLQNTT